MFFSRKELDIDSILNIVAGYTKTKTASQAIVGINPITDVLEITKMLSETADMLNHISRLGSLPLIADFDIFEILSMLDKGFILSISDIMQLRLLLIMERSINDTFLQARKLNINYQVLNDVISAIKNHSFILKQIEVVFDERGVIYDNATPELAKIRRQINLKQQGLDGTMKSILEKYQAYLTESIVTIRNDRYTIPVNIAYKNKIRGVVLDISKSGQTVYIEPQAAFNIYSELEYLRIKENDEMQKIIAQLTANIAASSSSLLENLHIFVSLDIIQAKACYAKDIEGYQPSINQEGNINIIKGRHPLIAKEHVVPIDVILNDDFKTMIITGPNTGGKTVALKTTGLFSLMVQMGLLVPCDISSNIAVFNNIYADIGDEQSIEQSLSTFSSHLKKIKFIMDNAVTGDLVLIDEIGSGTDPQEGASLAIAILDELKTKNLRLMVTTHYSDLKIYAFENEGIMSASVAFDEKTLNPLYYLVLGSSGTSNAFLIAKRLGVKEDVLAAAKRNLANKETDFAKVLNKLNQEKLEIIQKSALLKEKIDDYEKLIHDLNNEKDHFLHNKEKILNSIKKTESEKWEKLKEELKDLLATLRNKEIISLNEAASIKNKINQEITSDDITLESEEVLDIGDHVYIRPYQKYGEITNIKKNEYEVAFGDFKMRFVKDDLKKVLTKVAKEEKYVKNKSLSANADNISKQVSLEVDLRGYRYDEVKDALETAINKAIVANLNVLHIIHGFGTFAVKKAVMEVIKKSPYVASYRSGGEGEGLNGVTVIFLK